jgi:hypothetical protein
VNRSSEAADHGHDITSPGLLRSPEPILGRGTKKELRPFFLLTMTHPRWFQTIPEQWLILVTCRDEKQQVELLGRFKEAGLQCKLLVT